MGDSFGSDGSFVRAADDAGDVASDADVVLLGLRNYLFKTLNAFFNGAVDILAAERFRCCSKHGYFFSSSFNLKKVTR